MKNKRRARRPHRLLTRSPVKMALHGGSSGRRPELVGKRFLYVPAESPGESASKEGSSATTRRGVSGGEVTAKPKLTRVATWNWVSGVIRCSTHRDENDSDLQVGRNFYSLKWLGPSSSWNISGEEKVDFGTPILTPAGLLLRTLSQCDLLCVTQKKSSDAISFATLSTLSLFFRHTSHVPPQAPGHNLTLHIPLVTRTLPRSFHVRPWDISGVFFLTLTVDFYSHEKFLSSCHFQERFCGRISAAAAAVREDYYHAYLVYSQNHKATNCTKRV